MLFPIRTLIQFLLGIIEFFLIARFLLKLFGANPAAPFVSWIYETSDSMLEPFSQAFPTTRIEGFVFDFNTLFGLFVYILGAYLLTEFILFVERFGRGWKGSSDHRA